MAKKDDRSNPFVEDLKRFDDEDLASLSHTQAARALYEEVVSMSRSAENATSSEKTKTTRRKRLIWEGALVVGAAVIVLAVLSIVNVFGANGPSMVENAVAALDPAEDVVVHVKITASESGADGYYSEWTEESWSRTASPYSQRQIQSFPGQPVSETFQDATGLAQIYAAGTNTIYQPPQNPLFKYAGGEVVPYGEVILAMLGSGDAVLEGKDTFEGREVLGITATKDYGTAADGTPYGDWYYIDAKTNYPVALHQTRDGGKVVDIRFDVYEILPAGDETLVLFDLTAQHPGATLNTSADDYRAYIEQSMPAPEGGDAAK